MFRKCLFASSYDDIGLPVVVLSLDESGLKASCINEAFRSMFSFPDHRIRPKDVIFHAELCGILSTSADVNNSVLAYSSLDDNNKCHLSTCLEDQDKTHVLTWRRAGRKKVVVTLTTMLQEFQELHDILPTSMIRSLFGDGGRQPQQQPRQHFVTVMFIDIMGFTAMSSMSSPQEVFNFLRSFFRIAEDQVKAAGRTWTYETDGDCFIAVAGAMDTRLNKNDKSSFEISSDNNIYDGDQVQTVEAKSASRREDAHQVCKLAARIRDAVRYLPMSGGNSPTNIRIGIHSGPVCSGMIGGRMKLAGDTMNTAQRHEAACPKDCINLSGATRELIPVELRELCVPHTMDLKGKGATTMYKVDWSLFL